MDGFKKVFSILVVMLITAGIIGAIIFTRPRRTNPAQHEQRALLPPELIEEGYQGFNIVLYGGKFYDLAQSEGAFDIAKVRRKEYKKRFAGDSVEEVKLLISMTNDRNLPVDVLDVDYHGFYILFVNGNYFAVPKEVTQPDLGKIVDRLYVPMFVSRSYKHLRSEVLKQSESFTGNREVVVLEPPRFVEEGYRDFNIIQFDGKFYGLPRKEGPFSIDKVRNNLYEHCVVGGSVQEVKDMIDKLLSAEQ